MFVVASFVLVVRWYVSSVVCRLRFARFPSVVCCLLFVVCCVLCAACCLLRVAYCLCLLLRVSC